MNEATRVRMNNVRRARVLTQMFGDQDPYGALMASVSSQLREAREKAGFTQRELAAEAGTGQAQISYMERGTNIGVTLRSIHAYADACGCDVEVRIIPREE